MEQTRIGDTPWHLRQATHFHYQRFQHLMELHRLTEAWIGELQVDRASHTMNRGLGREVVENLWMLEVPTDRKLNAFDALEALLDDTTPEDVLGRLERTIWAVQSYTLARLHERTGEQERSILDSVLEQISWKLGRECAEKNWTQLPTENRQSLRKLLVPFSDTPFGCGSDGPIFLIQRATDAVAQIELTLCPHHTPYSEVRPVADALCRLHSHWIRGFAYGLNHRVQLEVSRSSTRCCLSWITVNGR